MLDKRNLLHLHIDIHNQDIFRMQQLRPIMFVGTCSDAGKSIINTAFCRIFLQDGYSPAPFKAQNMSLNSYSTIEGREMGRAQVVQAEACSIIPHTDMNPVLLKPSGETFSQVILNGHPIGSYSAKEYFASENKNRNFLFREALNAFHRLKERYNPIVLEGAGSISELNLKNKDITNMRMALHTQASTFLVADIDRGGIFGSVYGTIALLSPEEKALIKGIIINKFRGDTSLFEDGRKILKELTGIPVVGIVPYFHDIKIEEEDSVVLESKKKKFCSNKVNIAIIRLKQMSNFTDFDVLEIDSRFNLYYTNKTEDIEMADILVIPGSKNTLSDLQYLQESGTADTIVSMYKKGKKIIGICGGYQMMGIKVEDPDNIEGNLKSVVGLGLLPQYTIIEKNKITQQRKFEFLPSATNTDKKRPAICKGYEIHMGRTFLLPQTSASPVIKLENGEMDGYYLNNHCWGCYMHGIFDNPVILDYLAEEANSKSTLPFDYSEYKEAQYNKLAEFIRKHVDVEYIYSTLIG